jgi:hypothetical protein
MTTHSHTTTLATGARTLSALRALDTNRAWSLTGALETATRQAELLRELLPDAASQLASRLTDLMPSILVEQVDGIPVPSASFWAHGHWHIHIRASDVPDEQRFSVLHELKHIIDHPVRSQHPTLLSDGDWESAANHFATQVLTGLVENDSIGREAMKIDRIGGDT